MIPVQQSIEVNAPVSAVAAHWPRFIEWALVGPNKLACDELVCVDPTKDGVVRFEQRDDARARVVFEVEVPHSPEAQDDEEPSISLQDKLRHDLLLFKDYVENQAPALGKSEREVAASSLRKEKQRGRPSHRSGRGSDPGLPTLPSGGTR